MHYLRKPLICCHCKVFGHYQFGCIRHSKERESDNVGHNKMVVETVVKSKEDVECKVDNMVQKGNAIMPQMHKKRQVWIKVKKRNL